MHMHKHTHAHTEKEELKKSHWPIFAIHQANLNIPMGALRPGAGHPVKRREETVNLEEVRRLHTVNSGVLVCLFPLKH